MKYLFYVLLIVNLFGFLIMWWDKRCARKGARRVPERTLFLVALCGGAVGGLGGMYLFRHKTQHWRFTIGFPLILVVQIAAVAYFML